MGVQIAAVTRRYMQQMMAKAAAEQTDGVVQMGMNIKQMLANREAAVEKNVKVFGVKQVENFASPRTSRGNERLFHDVWAYCLRPGCTDQVSQAQFEVSGQLEVNEVNYEYLLNRGWEYVESGLQNPLLVNLLQGWKKTDLPHDYAVEKGRDRSSPAGLDEGFFQGAGLYYKKTFHLKDAAQGKRVWLEFEGVFGVTQVWVNKQFAAKHMNPYTSFWTDITPHIHSGDNEVMLHVDSRAVLAVSAQLSAPTDSITYTLLDTNGNPVAMSRDGTLTVESPRPWSVDDPYLYTLRAVVCANGCEDVAEEKIGIRTIEVDSRQGFRLTGKPMKLRGGCIHHDLGVLGAADYLAAERRRVRLLKDSGFNAVRLAHNPYGPAIFQACDELGMLCIEEAFDEWVLGRTSFGLHITFEDRWERDLECQRQFEIVRKRRRNYVGFRRGG